MQVTKLQLANKTLLNPAATQWARAPRVFLTLRGTEAQAQPSAYVRTAWAGRLVGAVRSVSVQAAHNRQTLFFRLEWTDSTHNPDYGDGSVFPDAAAVLFPMNGDAPLLRMGSPGAGIEAWYWRANRLDYGEALEFQGFATERQRPAPLVMHTAHWAEGSWQVVIGAALNAVKEKQSVAFAVWDGGSQERAGLHSVSPKWLDLSIA
jgi:DMSO reductase family type II enzyme heme b subunit